VPLPGSAYPRGVSLPDDERALLDRPVQHYIGLPIAEAEALATDEGRRIRVLASLTGPRHLDLMPSRVNVKPDDASRVVAADAG
jgi:hypothetical protein